MGLGSRLQDETSGVEGRATSNRGAFGLGLAMAVPAPPFPKMVIHCFFVLPMEGSCQDEPTDHPVLLFCGLQTVLLIMVHTIGPERLETITTGQTSCNLAVTSLESRGDDLKFPGLAEVAGRHAFCVSVPGDYWHRGYGT